MAGEEEYELMPHKKIEALKKEVEELKKGTASPEMQGSIQSLSDSINDLLGLFREASRDLNLEKAAESSVEARVDQIVEKLDQVIDQNGKIAEGIVAVADMVTNIKEKKVAPMPGVPPRLGSMPLRMAPKGPMPGGPPPMAPGPMPPARELPPLKPLPVGPAPEKKGLFGFGKK